jgi:hypothetical protein
MLTQLADCRIVNLMPSLPLSESLARERVLSLNDAVVKISALLATAYTLVKTWQPVG